MCCTQSDTVQLKKNDSFFTGAGSRDGSMGLWEISDEVLTQAEKCQNVEGVPGYSHISHSASRTSRKSTPTPTTAKCAHWPSTTAIRLAAVLDSCD